MSRVRRRWAGALAAICLLGAAAACQGSASSTPSSTHAPSTTAAAPHTTTSVAASRTSIATASATPSSSSSATASASSAVAHRRPVIVIDPGHSVTISATDPKTGLDVSDYENEPEMHDVFDVAELVRARLTSDGYRVVMTKTSVLQPRNLAQRARIANRVHAALALSIHDQAGSNGGIQFRHGNSVVYSQAVGDYRATASGRKVYFTDKRVAELSQRYGKIFRTQRARVEGDDVNWLDNTGYNLGSRGLPGGDIWLVQLLARVPWVYNEAGGNSAGQSGLDAADKRTYANALVASVEHCVPVN